MTARQVRRWYGERKPPPPEPPEPVGAVLAVVQVQGISWSIRRAEGFGSGWLDVVVERSPDKTARRTSGHRRRFKVRWNEKKWRFAQTPEACLLAFSNPQLFTGITDAMRGRSF